VVLVELPPSLATAEPHEDAVDEVSSHRQRTGTALPTPVVELRFRIVALREISYLGGPRPGRQDSSMPTRLIPCDSGTENIAALYGAAPRLAEQVGAKLRREHEGESHVVERAVGMKLLADPDLLLAVCEI
jgi:hypothetical protein